MSNFGHRHTHPHPHVLGWPTAIAIAVRFGPGKWRANGQAAQRTTSQTTNNKLAYKVQKLFWPGSNLSWPGPYSLSALRILASS